MHCKHCKDKREIFVSTPGAMFGCGASTWIPCPECREEDYNRMTTCSKCGAGVHPLDYSGGTCEDCA
jgi:hypothetical protein